MKKKIMHFLFLSCLKATELIEKKFHVKLSFGERLQLELHKMMCDACKTYEKQSIVLEEGLKSEHCHHHHHSLENEADLLKEKIRLRLEETKN